MQAIQNFGFNSILDFKKIDKKIAIHFDFSLSTLNYNVLFYEMFYLSFINDNSRAFCSVSNNIHYFIEIANTF